MAVRAEIRVRDDRTIGADALESLYETYAPALHRRCTQLTRNPESAEDLMQDVFVRFLARFPEVPDGMNVPGYLFATARNVRWKQLRDDHDDPDGDIETTAGADDDLERDPERSALLDEQREGVRDATSQLTDRSRTALTLREVEGKSYAEIGSHLGLGVDAVGQVITRARVQVRRAMRQAQISVEGLSPECGAMLGPLADYLDRPAASTSAEVEAHLATCPDCRHTLASYQETGARLRGLAPFAPLMRMLSQTIGDGNARLRIPGTLTLAASAAICFTAITPPPQHAVAAAPVASAPVSHPAQHAPATPPTTGGSSPGGGAGGGTGGGRIPAAQPAQTTPATPVRHAREHVPPAPSGRVASKTTAAVPATGGHAAPPQAAPAVTAPKVTAPAASTPRAPIVTVPTITVPTITVPKITVPAITVPKVTVPGVTVPAVTPPPVTVPPVVVPPVASALLGFSVIAGSGVTNTGLSTIAGDIGAFPTPSITGLVSLTVGGANHAGDAVTQQAKADLVTAYDTQAAKASTSPISADLGGRTLTPGVYTSASSIGLTGTVTLDGQGNPGSVFVFQAGSTLTTASLSRVVLVGGAQACNVYWQVGSSATLGTFSTFRGTILALTSITATTGVTIEGRLFARNGAVTLDTDILRTPGCSS
jgi:RNA polymerase sigma factor (sigma-70 family)